MSADLPVLSLKHAKTFFDLNGERVPAESHVEELSALLGFLRERRAAQGIASHHSIIGTALPKSAICIEHGGTSLTQRHQNAYRQCGFQETHHTVNL